MCCLWKIGSSVPRHVNNLDNHYCNLDINTVGVTRTTHTETPFIEVVGYLLHDTYKGKLQDVNNTAQTETPVY